MDSSGDRSEIVFFDVETTVPSRAGQGFALLEFGAILVCPRKLVELESYSTLVRPADLSSVPAASCRCNGITRDAIASAPTFREIADRVYDILHGRIWAGHNIVKFDYARIREAFAEIGRPAPEPKGSIDSLTLLTQKFGRRAGDMKMATLATYFGLGQQKHRSLDDVRMNLEVLKYCATVLFLESSLPDIFTANSWVSPNAITRSRSNGKVSPAGTKLNMTTPPSDLKFKNHQISSPMTAGSGAEVLSSVKSNVPQADHFDMSQLIDQMNVESLQLDANMEEPTVLDSNRTSIVATPNGYCSSQGTLQEGNPTSDTRGTSCSEAASGDCSGYAGFLEPEEISIPSISVSLVPFYRGIKRIQLLHKDVLLQLYCTKLRVRFGVSTKFFDHAGRPRLSIVVDPSPSLCQVLDTCDHLAQRLSMESGSDSEWRPVVNRKNGFSNSTIRLHIPIVPTGDISVYGTEIYQKEASGSAQRLVFSRFDAAELDSLFVPGTLVDAYFSLDVYDYQQNAGIRLLAKRLFINSK
ncbi:PREDICTED: protein NEN1-like [Nelumbo nucifera]|uniref:Exonuclease domain-containing protein n=2 Tax=Nelumbo nucifera TaxID=4432 RepID=A0A822Z0D6_NELNU|nr:PREDICTED: protein NEN1-like [Nelumbo nucifera]DAD34938.1 TPA_asm: hypothetical protein HUJ06_005578 [Nelumbo nucifera]